MDIKRFLAVALAIASSCVGMAQIAQDYAPSIQNTGFNKEDNAVAVTYDSFGATYLTGTAQYTLAGGTRNAVWTMKLDNQGLVVWNQLGRAGLNGENDFAKGIVVDGLGNTYVAAEANRTPTTSSMILIKYDPAGNIQWRRFYVGKAGAHNIPVGVGVDATNKAYIGGTAGDGINADFAMAQFSGGGIMNWHHEYDVAGDEDQCVAMKVVPSGQSYLVSSSKLSNGNHTSWVVSFNSVGTTQYDNGIQDSSAAFDASDIAVGPNGAVVIVGRKTDTATSLYAARFDSVGVFEWIRNYNPFPNGVVTNVGGLGVAVGLDGSAYVTGAVQTSAVNPGYTQATLLKWDFSGGFQYERFFGNPSQQTRGRVIRVDNFGRVYIAWENSVNMNSYRQCGVATFNGVSGSSLASKLFGNNMNLNRAGDITFDTKGRIYFVGTNKQIPNSANFVAERFIQPVVCFNQAFSAKKNTLLHKPVAQGVFANARYYVNASAILITGPTHGNLTLNANGAFDYNPTPGYTGPDSFTFRGDQAGLSGNVVTVSIYVNP